MIKPKCEYSVEVVITKKKKPKQLNMTHRGFPTPNLAIINLNICSSASKLITT